MWSDGTAPYPVVRRSDEETVACVKENVSCPSRFCEQSEIFIVILRCIRWRLVDDRRALKMADYALQQHQSRDQYKRSRSSESATLGSRDLVWSRPHRAALHPPRVPHYLSSAVTQHSLWNESHDWREGQDRRKTFVEGIKQKEEEYIWSEQQRRKKEQRRIDELQGTRKKKQKRTYDEK